MIVPGNTRRTVVVTLAAGAATRIRMAPIMPTVAMVFCTMTWMGLQMAWPSQRLRHLPLVHLHKHIQILVSIVDLIQQYYLSVSCIAMLYSPSLF
jgi:hypothetical protein